MQGRNTLWRAVLLLLLVYALCSFASARRLLSQTVQEERRLSAELAGLEEENRRLRELLRRGPDEELLESLARERLGLVLPGEKIFYFDTDRED
mgnify:CR=1 FL=1